MKQDDVIRLAKVWLSEYGIKELQRGADVEITLQDLEAFAKLVAEHERKEWAKEFAGMGEWAAVHLLEAMD